MPSRFTGIKNFLFWAFLGLIPQGFICPQNQSVVLPTVQVDSLRLALFDTLSLQPGVEIFWSFPDSSKGQIFQPIFSFHPDSQPIIGETKFSGQQRQAIAPLPDTIKPFLIYVGLQVSRKEPTGQIVRNDSIHFLPLEIKSSIELISPPAGSIQDSQFVVFETMINNDVGILPRLEIHRLEENQWKTLIDTCFPINKCGIPLFGKNLLTAKFKLPFADNGNDNQAEARWCITAHEGSSIPGPNPPQAIECRGFIREKP